MSIIESLRPGDIVLVRYPFLYFLGWCIQVIGRDMWAHAALYIGDGDVIEAKGSGVRKASISEVLKSDSMVSLKYRIYRPNDISLGKIKKVIQYCEDRIGWGYDHNAVGFVAVFKLLERWGLIQKNPLINPLNEEDKEFCTELVAGAYAYAGYPLVDIASSLVRAGDIALSPKVSMIEI